jgi:hypothetical protein
VDRGSPTGSGAEISFLISEIEDELEDLARADRLWGRWTFPTILGVAGAIYLAVRTLGVPGVSLWILMNVLIALAIVHGGRVLRDRQRLSLRERKEELKALEAASDTPTLETGPPPE